MMTCFDAADDERRGECALGDPIHGRRGEGSFRIRGEDVKTIWNHTQNRFLGIGIQPALLFV